MLIHTDCRYFLGSKPCVPHKKYGAQCETCTSYEPVSLRILIVKLDSMGDVLRTTSVLPALREEHPACFITWITRREAVELIAHNPHLDELLVLEAGALSQLLVRKFDLVLGLDMSRDRPVLQINAASASMLPVLFSRSMRARKTGFTWGLMTG
ncbi:MAG: hypothetical protein NTV89_03620 [Proteobacteria bacterium]|nr:hypothetical protein [Pseudomonadota bacterium]